MVQKHYSIYYNIFSYLSAAYVRLLHLRKLIATFQSEKEMAVIYSSGVSFIMVAFLKRDILDDVQMCPPHWDLKHDEEQWR